MNEALTIINLTCSLSSFQINDQGLEHMESLNYAAKLLNSCSILSLTLAKSCNTINSLMGGPLSSSSSGHNMHENETQNQNHQQNSSSQAQNHQTTGKNDFSQCFIFSPLLKVRISQWLGGGK